MLARLRFPLLSLLVLGSPLGLQGQSRSAVCRVDSASSLHTLDLYLSLVTPDSIHGTLRQGYQGIALTLASTFVQPLHLTLPGWPGTYYPIDQGTPLRPWFGVGGYLTLELTRDGALNPNRLRVVSGSAQLSTALRLAVLRADSLRAFPSLTKDLYPRDGRFVFEIRESITPLADHVAFGRLRLRALEIQVPARLNRPAMPHYPLAAEFPHGVSGFAHFQFVIDTSGHPIPGSFVLLETNYREFADAALAAIKASTFYPATIGGCPVPSLVHQRVRFLISR
jgi:hypothetical protein